MTMDQQYLSDDFHLKQDEEKDVPSIRQIAYELYKQDWTRTFIDKNQMMNTCRDYFTEIMTKEPNQKTEDFDSWVQKNGYTGCTIAKKPVSFEEFVQTMYKAPYSMCKLLQDELFIDAYRKDLQELENQYPDIKVGDIVKKDDNLYNVIATAKETGTQFVLRGIENKETVVFAKAEEIEKTNQILPRIYFETINCDGDLRTWSFNSTEEIAKEWWSEHCDLPGYDDPLVTFQITGKSIPSHNFGDLVSFFDLENDKWREKYYVDDREEQSLDI